MKTLINSMFVAAAFVGVFVVYEAATVPEHAAARATHAASVVVDADRNTDRLPPALMAPAVAPAPSGVIAAAHVRVATPTARKATSPVTAGTCGTMPLDSSEGGHVTLMRIAGGDANCGLRARAQDSSALRVF